MVRLEIRDFATLDALKQSSTFRRASERLHVSETALSKRLADLESRVGCELVKRDRRPYVFTEAGNLLCARGLNVLQAAQSVSEEFERFRSGRSNRLYVAIECHSCYDWFFDALNDFERSRPDVDLAALDEFRFEALAPLREGRLDLVITADPEPQRDVELSYIRLFNYEARLAVAASHPLAKKPTIQPSDLADETLLTFPVPQYKQHIFKAFLFPSGTAPRNTLPLQDPRFILYRVSRNRGVACLPDWAIRSFAKQYDIVSKRLGDSEKGIEATMYAAVRTDMHDLPDIQDFCKLAIHSFKRRAAQATR